MELTHIYAVTQTQLKRDRLVVSVFFLLLLMAVLAQMFTPMNFGWAKYLIWVALAINALNLLFFGAVSRSRYVTEAHKNGHSRDAAEAFWDKVHPN